MLFDKAFILFMFSAPHKLESWLLVFHFFFFYTEKAHFYLTAKENYLVLLRGT